MKHFRLSLLAFGLVATAACQPTPPERDYNQEALERGAEKMAACGAASCTTLNLDGARLENYGDIAALTHVNKLMVSYTTLPDISALTPMVQLSELHIGQTKVKSLSPLSAFPNLKLLHAQGLDLSDISPVAQLRGLQELVIGTYKLTDISAVKQLRHLKVLDISDSKVADLSALKGHPSLEVVEMLNLSQRPDLAPLLTLRKLRSVTIDQHNLDAAGEAVVAKLRAKGVKVTAVEAVIVC